MDQLYLVKNVTTEDTSVLGEYFPCNSNWMVKQVSKNGCGRCLSACTGRPEKLWGKDSRASLL